MRHFIDSIINDRRAISRSAIAFLLFFTVLYTGCKKGSDDAPILKDTSLSFTVNGAYNGSLTYTSLNTKPVIAFTFTDPIDPVTVSDGIRFQTSASVAVPFSSTLSDGNRTLTITPVSDLLSFSTYTLSATSAFRSAAGGKLINAVNISLSIGLDNTDKFAVISDNALLDLVQKQTLKYFYDFGHPVSGLARERSTSGETVTTGGSGFGVMAMVAGASRGFITRNEALLRIQKIVTFLNTKADRFHGAFSHWLNGTTGKVQPFSANDNGADLVETSFLLQGLITARQYFNGANPEETALRAEINAIYNSVEWDWFRQGGQNALYWHWSPDKNWAINLKVGGWNEALMVYVLAASSTTSTIPKAVYDSGWANNGAMKNGNNYYGYNLPLGTANGGPLFLSHYSFMAIDPNGLSDAYANYELQTKNHTLINRAYCIANPKGYVGYSADCWGLTASDTYNGYTASSPSNDVGTIAPTAAIASMPYTPAESMQALKFFYYKLGNRTWGEYGFVDAFNLSQGWFDTQTLAIDQGPIIVMIENHRSKLLWNLFMSAPEVKAGMRKLGFTGPSL
ncbi:MAG: beta-glucosidase [Pedobacter sp.]|nr:MAG: beta-glucosidase [Pedobacter sp.]